MIITPLIEELRHLKGENSVQECHKAKPEMTSYRTSNSTSSFSDFADARRPSRDLQNTVAAVVLLPLPLQRSNSTQITMFGGFGAGAMGGMPQRFEECYHCYSVAYADKSHLEVSRVKVSSHHGSDRINPCKSLATGRMDRCAFRRRYSLVSVCYCSWLCSLLLMSLCIAHPPSIPLSLHRHDRPTIIMIIIRPECLRSILSFLVYSTHHQNLPERRQDPFAAVGL